MNWEDLLYSLLIAAFLISTVSMAEIKYEYPELLVSPQASASLKRFAKEEKEEAWTIHIWSQFPAVINLWSGFRAFSEKHADPDKEQQIHNAGLASASLSGGWLALTVGLSQAYSPYKKDYLKIRKLPDKTKRQQLVKERLAEEALYSAYSFGLKLKYAGAIINFAAAMAVAGNSEDDITGVQAGVAALSSFLPILFPYTWIGNYKQHQTYKKRIYGPITQLIPTIRNDGLGTQLSLTWSF